MNRELLIWYKGLEEKEKQGLRSKASDAPVMLRLLEFLERCQDSNFTTLNAVRALYPDEFQSVAFEKLRNRFFKIRKELHEFKNQPVPDHLENLPLHPLELKYFQLRAQVRSPYSDTALRGLKELSLECKRNNVFELYPQVLRDYIYGLLLKNEHAKSRDILTELNDAVSICRAWDETFVLYRMAYDQHLQHTGLEEVKAILRKIKQISARFPGWQRFKMAYHFTALTFETSHMTANNREIMKHFQTLEKLMEQHPETPVFYWGPNLSVQTMFQFDQFRINFNFIRGNFESAYEAYLKNWHRIRTGSLNRPVSELDFRNKIKLELATRRFDLALQSVKDLIAFQKSAGMQENILSSYREMAMVYIFGFPELQPPDSGSILRNLEQKLKQDLTDTGKASREYAETLTSLCAFLLIRKKYQEAFEKIQNPLIRQYYGAEAYSIVKRLYEIPIVLGKLSREERNQQLERFTREIQDQYDQSSDRVFQHLLQFILKMAGHYQKNGF